MVVIVIVTVIVLVRCGLDGVLCYNVVSIVELQWREKIIQCSNFEICNYACNPLSCFFTGKWYLLLCIVKVLFLSLARFSYLQRNSIDLNSNPTHQKIPHNKE